MFSLSKKSEYGLMALIHLSRMDNKRLLNVSEIARSTSIPKELLAKVLSELVKANLAVSYSGPTGGFRLARPASEITLAEILRTLENRTGLLECLSGDSKCRKMSDCAIRSPMIHVNHRIRKILEETFLADLISKSKSQDLTGRAFPMMATPSDKSQD